MKQLRRRRHRANAKVRVIGKGPGKRPVRGHRRIGGRTGSIKSKQTPSSKLVRIKRVIANKAMFWI